MSYELLLDDLESLQKSYAEADAEGAEDDAKIQAAAEAARAGKDDDEKQDGEDSESDDDADADPDAPKPKGKPFGKSFVLVDEAGSEMEAIDGTEMVKSLHDQVGALSASFDADKGALVKSMTALRDIVMRQDKLIKSLSDKVADLSAQGVGRKSVSAPTGTMAKSINATPDLIKSRADAAFTAGRISGKDYTVIDVALRHGMEIDPAMINRIMAE